MDVLLPPLRRGSSCYGASASKAKQIATHGHRRLQDDTIEPHVAQSRPLTSIRPSDATGIGPR